MAEGFKFSMDGKAPFEPPRPPVLAATAPDEPTPVTSRHTDQLNQHMLLTVQSINRLQTILTTRGS